MCPSGCLNWKVVSTKNILIQQERTWRETPGVICRKSMLLIKFLNFKYILGCFGRQLVQCVWCVLLCTAAPNVTLCHGSGPYPQCEWVQNCSSWCFHRADATSPHSSGQRADPWLQFQVPAVRTMQQMHKEVAATTAVWYVDNTGRTSFLTPGTQKLPHPHGTQGYPWQTGSYPRDQILLAHWYHTIVGLANKVVKMCPCHCETHI